MPQYTKIKIITRVDDICLIFCPMIYATIKHMLKIFLWRLDTSITIAQAYIAEITSIL